MQEMLVYIGPPPPKVYYLFSRLKNKLAKILSKIFPKFIPTLEVHLFKAVIIRLRNYLTEIEKYSKF